MTKVSKQTAAKVGLFSTVMMIIGSVVGIGIFFKNISVFKANNYNWIGILISWFIAIFMVLCIGLSFAEISSCKLNHPSDGLGGWSERYCGHGFGRFTRICHSIVYYPIIVFSVIIFAGEALLNAIQSGLGEAGTIDFGKGTTAYIFLAGGVLFTLFLFLNYFKSKQMFKFGKATGFIKILPLLAALVIGITMGVLNKYPGGLFIGKYWDPSISPDLPWQDANPYLNPIGIIGTIPAILFTFEGYLVVGNIGNQMEKPEKNVPLAIILVIVVISIVNIAITIAFMASGTGNINELISMMFGGDKENIGCIIVTTIMSIFIFVCVIGVLNGLIYTGISACHATCEHNVLFNSKHLLSKKPNSLYAGTIWFGLTTAAWWLVLLIPSAILNTDRIADGSSNIVVALFYLFYGIILLFGFINRFTKKVEVRKLGIFPVTALIGVVSCFFVFGFLAFFQYLVIPIIDPNNYQCAESWGLFAQGPYLLNWQVTIIFWVLAGGMIFSVFLNDILIKHLDKKYDQKLIWQKQA